MNLYDLIMNAPDDARVSILYRQGEDICDVRELKGLLIPRDDVDPDVGDPDVHVESERAC